MLSIALGGAIGSVLRWLSCDLLAGLLGTALPFGVFFVNILGSFVMGFLIAGFAEHWQASQTFRSFLMVGVLGGFTTFSSFSADTILLWQRGETIPAGLYACGSVVIALAALLGGMTLARTIFA